MALNGIIFGGLVVLWAVFLVPWALRRYDEAMSERPIETFSDAMRVLGRRAGSPEPRFAPAQEAEQPIASRRSLRTDPAAQAGASVRRTSRAAARAAAARRRRVLLTLIAATLVVVALAAFAVVPAWAPAIPGGLVICWLVLCRVQARKEADAAWEGRDRSVEADEPDVEDTQRVNTGAVPAPSHTPPGDGDKVSEADLLESAAVAVPVATDDESSLWDPLPVTLPTYVSKPKAARSIRTIDLSAPDTWTSGHVDGEQIKRPVQEGQAEHRRAVGD